MPKRNWDNYDIYYKGSGEIVIGIKEKKQPLPGLITFSESSGNQTNQAVSAVMQYMNHIRGDDAGVQVAIPGYGTLMFQPAEKDEDDEEATD